MVLEKSEANRQPVPYNPDRPIGRSGFFCRLPRAPNPRRAARRLKDDRFSFSGLHSFIIRPVIHFSFHHSVFSSSFANHLRSPHRILSSTLFFHFLFSLSFLIFILLSTIIY